MANKIRAGTGAIVGVVAVVMLVVNATTWAQVQKEEIMAETTAQIQAEVLIQQGRAEAVQTSQAREMQKQSAKHDYDFYEIRGMQAEEQLVQLEEEADAGVKLTASQQRKMRRLEKQVENFQNEQDKALITLSEAEANNET